jgi:ribulose-5-phosphate 4-epimerase/fuculose-1-phosphate aldolase
MIKGIPGHSNSEWCKVPIIENTEKECELTERLEKALVEYPRSNAVLVRNHGIYVWGRDWK